MNDVETYIYTRRDLIRRMNGYERTLVTGNQQ